MIKFIVLVTLVCSTLPSSAATAANDPRPPFCVANALNLAECAKAWQRMVLDGARSATFEETWNAAEFQGFVDGVYFGTSADAAKQHKWCPRTLESKDQLYSIVASYLIKHSAVLTADTTAIEYTTKALSHLWPCRANTALRLGSGFAHMAMFG